MTGRRQYYSLGALHPGDVEGTEEFQYPIPLERLPKSLQEGNATSSKYAPYEMDDLTIPSWMGLAGDWGIRRGRSCEGGSSNICIWEKICDGKNWIMMDQMPVRKGLVSGCGTRDEG